MTNGGRQSVSCDFADGKRTKECALEGSESGISLVCARSPLRNMTGHEQAGGGGNHTYQVCLDGAFPVEFP